MKRKREQHGPTKRVKMDHCYQGNALLFQLWLERQQRRAFF